MLANRLQRIEFLLDALDPRTRRRRQLPARQMQTAPDVIRMVRQERLDVLESRLVQMFDPVSEDQTGNPSPER